MRLKFFFTVFLLLILAANITLSQINSFPSTESFEQPFTTGSNVVFITNWTGNEVQASTRIFQGANARTGAASLNVIPISSFTGEVLIALNFTNNNNPLISFYAYSKQNGAISSTRPVLLSFSTSIDGGVNYLDNVQIGDNTTFPNDNNTSYTRYTYSPPAQAASQSNVVVKITMARGDGAGSAAELVMDDFLIEQVLTPLAINSAAATDATTVVVNFNQEVTQITAENIANYAINNGIVVNSASRIAANQVRLSTTAMANANYQLTVNGVADAASNTPANNLTAGFNYVNPLAVNTTNVISKNTLEISFNQDLDETTAETISNYAVDNGIGNPSLAVRDNIDKNKVTLTFVNDLASQNYVLTINGVKDFSTLAISSNLITNFNYLPLEISGLSIISSTSLQIQFNQNVDATSANLTSNYSLNYGYNTPVSAVRNGTELNKVLLTFTNSLVNNTYTLTVNNVTNSTGNAIAMNRQANVTNSVQTNYRNIVINEIFADPTGAAQPDPQTLPSGTTNEFIELFNASTQAIDLASFDLTGGTIGSFVLHPNAYVILTSTSNVALFQPFGDVVGVTSWNTLTNGGEQILLKDNLGNLVDSLTFDLTWYKDNAKSDGGWSLEQINPERICSDVNNWQASNAAQGATPAAQNSLYDNSPDTARPNIARGSVDSNQQITLVFDEIMDLASLNGGNYSVNNGIGVTSFVANSNTSKSVQLNLASPLVSGNFYTVTATGLTDCAGNTIENNQFTFYFDNLAPVFQRIILNTPTSIDIIFDEELNQTVAETESNYSLDPALGNPSRSTFDLIEKNRVNLTFATSLLEGSNYTLNYQNIADTIGNSIAVSQLGFSFVDQIDTVIVLSSQLLDVYFTEDVDEVSAEIAAKYSVNSSIGSPVSASKDNTNARLVHLVFNTAFPENTSRTIAFKDIRATNNSFLQLLNTNFVFDTDDPDITSVVVIDENSVQVSYDEIVDLTSAESLNNYTVNNGLGNPSRVILQADKRSVILDFGTNFEQEVENRLTVTGISDLSGNTISTNRNENFTYDRLAPRLNGIKVTGPTTIEVTFSEEVTKSIAENEANYSIDNGIGQPISAIRSAENTNIVELTFTTLGNNASNTLTIANISDVFENGLPVNLVATFSSLKATFGTFTILNDTTIQIKFTKLLDKTSAEDITNFGFDNGIGLKSVVQDQSNASLLTLNLTTALKIGISYRLVVQQLLDLDGNRSDEISFDFVYSTHIVDIAILNQNTLVLTFDQELDETSAETITNYSLNGGIGNPITAVRSTTDFKVVTLLFDKPFSEGIQYELTVQNLLDFYFGIINASKTKLTYDLTPPIILAVNSHYLNEIEVVFNEALNATTARTINHYSLNNGIGIPVSATIVAGTSNKVVLSFAQNLSNGAYQLTVDRVQDQQGKAIVLTTFDFTFVAPINPQFRELVINEVYFDTKSSSSLPNAEFIEIYNRGAQNIELRDFKITDKRDTAAFLASVLAPDEYLTVTTQGAATQYLAYGKSIGLNNFPSLSNTGESIYLIGRNGVVLDSIAYDLTFYNDVTKQSGGFSIELINPDKPCYEFINYAASIAPLGATPGAQNSVYSVLADLASPQLEAIEVITTSQLKLTFSEAMDLSTLIPAHFGLQDGITVTSIQMNDPFGRNVLLNLSAPFTKGFQRVLTVSNVADCSGNALSSSSFNFIKGDVPNYHDLIITEIMPTPSPSKGLPLAEYVEIYNRSNRIIELEGLFFADNDGSYKLSQRTIAPDAYLILAGNSAANALVGYGEVLAINSFPTLTIEDEARIKDAQGNIVFEVAYDKSFYQSDAKDDGGYSIELINPEATCFDNSNWTASNSNVGGTPGTQNSVYDITPDTNAPLVSSISVESEQQLKLIFNESMDATSVVASAFSFSNGLQVANLQILDVFAKEILINLSTQITRGIVNTLTVAGVRDCEGNIISTTNLDFYMGDEPGFQELIITEIMANPSPSQGLPNVEYLELYNTSNRIISVSGLILSDGTSATTLSSYNIYPNQYLILAPNNDKVEMEAYGDVLGVNNWPSLNTNGDEVSLYSGSQEIHTVIYDLSWYRTTAKSAGGFSLELIDINYPCVGQPNWNASSASIGGTPGAFNSVNASNPDLIGPSLIDAVALNSTQLKLTFDEKLSRASVESNNFTINQGITVQSVNLSVDGKEVIIDLGSAIQSNTAYQIQVENVVDCSGNLILADAKEATVVIAVEAVVSNILINEILFDPRAGGVRFVELYNNSNKYINLKDWRLEGVSNDRVISTADVIFAPFTYKTITTDATILKNQYANTDLASIVVISTLPSLPSDQGSVAIVSKTGIEVDQFDYSEDYHSPLLNSVDGVSLERIRLSAPTNDANNWQSASSQVGFATPGLENSQFQSTPTAAAIFNVEPKAFAPDVVGGANFTSINFDFERSGNVLTVSIYDANGNLVKEVSQNTLVGATGFFRWDGTTTTGEKARLGYYLILIQIIDPSGKVSLQKETVAVGTRF
ncbi:MAG: hypothetical protein COW03_07525 [Cytophagales bacterium CG12_big_fil_rev_8_21_14_0_65_40_12]|nr:MAG: hypothetical protein COW03_07525 [Cytophagales bacterium CG12_big_fil_rev_8_21_14_0_65_40_12]PIW04093.1 MAG: hypothetical protein COW40_11440 [Cytophagales bacterium CG17_big_fil_post_rev_8_21_14_2_50_40_13]